MNEQPSILPPSPEEAERLALEAAVAEARADPRPGILHEDVRREMRAEMATFPVEDERQVLEAAVEAARADVRDGRVIAHELAREWLLRLAEGELDAPRPPPIRP